MTPSRFFTFFKDHFAHRSLGWWVVLVMDFCFFVASMFFFPFWAVVTIPTAWGVGYLLGIGYTESRWAKSLFGTDTTKD